MPKSSFLTDIQTLRKRARQHIEEGSEEAEAERRPKHSK